MIRRSLTFGLILLACVAPAWSAGPTKSPQTYQIPYRLTDTLHVLVRAKINGQGPFNFIVDTGAPMLVVSTGVGKKLGLQAAKDGWTTLDRFEIEGGAVQTKIKCRVETPFQLEGMNGLGLTGVELHGMMGYTVLARYRLEFDFTRDKMKWTELEFSPPPPLGIGGKDKSVGGGLEILGSFMKVLGVLAGKNTEAEFLPRGFVGIELTEANGAVAIEDVLAKTPAAKAGLKKGDRIDRVQGRSVRSIADVHKLTERITAGQQIPFSIRRGVEKLEITVTAGDGL
jgi:hypothetical protein